VSATTKQIQMAAQLYDMRDKAKRLLGHKYKAKMADLGHILTMTAERDHKSVLAVATEVCKKRELMGMDLLLVMSAAVELMEPSE
jgi:adenine deaminase